MKKIIVTLLAISSMVFANADVKTIPLVKGDSVDNTGLYLGAGISAMSTRLSSVSRDIFNEKFGQERLGNAAILGGYMINNYLSVEGRYASNITDEDKVTMDSQWSLFLKPMYKFEDDKDQAEGRNYFAIYGLLGYGGIDLTGTNTIIAEVSDTGFQWGLGFSYTFRETASEGNYQYKDSWTVYADYTMLGTDMDGLYYTGRNEVDADAFTVGLIYKF